MQGRGAAYTAEDWERQGRDGVWRHDLLIGSGGEVAEWKHPACSLVGFWVGLGWLVLIYYERKTLLAGWFGLAETNQRTG